MSISMRYVVQKGKQAALFTQIVTIQNDKKLYTCTKEILKYRIAGLQMKKG